jgi:hypothetical protein
MTPQMAANRLWFLCIYMGIMIFAAEILSRFVRFRKEGSNFRSGLEFGSAVVVGIPGMPRSFWKTKPVKAPGFPNQLKQP